MGDIDASDRSPEPSRPEPTAPEPVSPVWPAKWSGCGWRWPTARWSIARQPSMPELFDAARVGLGAFGVLTEVTVPCVPAFLLAADEHPEPLDAVLDGFDERMAAADHVEFYWFPHTDTALVKSNQRLPLDAERRPVPRLAVPGGRRTAGQRGVRRRPARSGPALPAAVPDGESAGGPSGLGPRLHRPLAPGLHLAAPGPVPGDGVRGPARRAARTCCGRSGR